MKNLMLVIITLIAVFLPAYAQNPTPGYYLIYGNRDGSPVDVNIDSDIKIEVWAATPAIGSGYEDLDSNGVVDTTVFIGSPLASNDSVITSRDNGEFFYPLTLWDDPSFCHPNPDSTPGYTNQSIVCFCCLNASCENCFATDGDTVHIATFFMRTASDTSLISQMICPFKEGYHPVFSGMIWSAMWGIEIFPRQTFSCLNFVEYSAGDANGSGDVNGLDVTFMVAYLKGYGPPPDPIFAGDVNGDCLANGLDIIYLVAYLKGTGPEPFLGSCH